MTVGKGFVTGTAFKKHLDGDWRTVHELWSHIRNYMTSYAAPDATTYTKTELDAGQLDNRYYTETETDAFFEGYSGGGKAQVDAGNVVGLTQGSIPYADASGFLTEDNSNLFWDAGNNQIIAQRVMVRTTANAAVILDAGYGGEPGNQIAFIDFKIHSVLIGNIAVNEAVSGTPLEINSATAYDLCLVTGGGNVCINTLVHSANMVGGIQIGTGTAPTANQADTFAFYSADFAGGNACPYFRTEDGTVIGLNQSLLTTDSPTYVGLNLSGELDMTGVAACIDLNPAGTGTKKIIDITPSASLIAGRTWDGVYIDVDALDPATGDACTIHGFHFTALNFASTDYDAQVIGFITRAGAVDDFSGFQATLTELTQDKGQNAFKALGGSPALSATGKYRGLYVDYDSLTRNAGAPILEGVRVMLPADYTDFGVSFAGYFEGDGRSVTLCDTTYALDVSGTTRLSNLTVTDYIYFDKDTEHVAMIGYEAGKNAAGGGTYNTFIGESAGYSLTTGDFNFFCGFEAGYYNQTGAENFYAGYRAGKGAVNQSHSYNTMIGSEAGLAITTGTNNTFIGRITGKLITTGFQNTVIGSGALSAGGINCQYDVCIGYAAGQVLESNFNVLIGAEAGQLCTTAGGNVYVGYRAGKSDVDFGFNTAIGAYAMGTNRQHFNVAIGYAAGALGTAYYNNVFVGMNAGYKETAHQNVMIGTNSGYEADAGGKNTYVGDNTAYYNEAGVNNVIIGCMAGFGEYVKAANHYNTMVGYQSGYYMKGTTGNTFLGYQSGHDITTGDYNVCIGYMAGDGRITTESHQLWIANSNTATPLIYGEFDNCLININGTLAVAYATIGDDERGLSSIHTLSDNPAKSDGIGFYSEGHIGAITTDGPTYGAGIWLNIDSGATLGADVRALDIGIYEDGATCTGRNAYGLAIHMEFDDTNPPAAIYPFRINCNDTPGHATPAGLIFAPNPSALGLVIGDPGTADDAYLKIKLQDGSVYRIPLVKE